MTDNFTSIPIIDFSLSTSSATKPIFLSELRDAILKVGFFYLKTHPIPEDVQQGLLAQTAQFFDLPPEKKEEVDIINSKHFLGYIGQEATKSKSTNDRRETYTIGMDQPAPGGDEPLHRNLRGPNLWPQESDLPEFLQTVQRYRDDICRLADDFKSLIAEALDLEPTAFLKLFNNPPDNRLTLAKYPPPPASSDDEFRYQGIGTHKDSSFLNLPSSRNHAYRA